MSDRIFEVGQIVSFDFERLCGVGLIVRLMYDSVIVEIPREHPQYSEAWPDCTIGGGHYWSVRKNYAKPAFTELGNEF